MAVSQSKTSLGNGSCRCWLAIVRPLVPAAMIRSRDSFFIPSLLPCSHSPCGSGPSDRCLLVAEMSHACHAAVRELLRVDVGLVAAQLRKFELVAADDLCAAAGIESHGFGAPVQRVVVASSVGPIPHRIVQLDDDDDDKDDKDDQTYCSTDYPHPRVKPAIGGVAAGLVVVVQTAAGRAEGLAPGTRPDRAYCHTPVLLGVRHQAWGTSWGLTR